jgi:hypothetical protein
MGWQYARPATVAQLGGRAVERLGRDRVVAVAGVVFVVLFVVGRYVAPDLVYPEEQVGSVEATFYVNYEGRLLARAILFGVASVGLLVLREQRRGAAAEAPRIHGAATPPRICAPATIAATSPAIW